MSFKTKITDTFHMISLNPVCQKDKLYLAQIKTKTCNISM